ncbi:Golgi transport complex subunit 4 [Elasticomyces elasticus]|nr:Golgi transport complex subunit 4 [Elasticomyces elasticus]
MSADNHVSQTQSIYTATSVAEIRNALVALSLQEASVTSRLNALLESQKDLSRSLNRLDLARAQLGTQAVTARSISNGMLASAASTANRISGAVKRLDQEQKNVKATLEVVEQVAELKSCVLGVHGSMGAPQDWETAASYLHRASKIPKEVVDSTFAEENVPTAEVPDPPRVTLDAAAESLCGLFLREFEKATKETDGAKITRFFKLFPLIGRSEVGLDAYGRYVCGGVAARARNNLSQGKRGDNMLYANALTKLFEHVAQIIDGHEPLVERHYGTGMMIRVIERLQTEADVQGGILLDTWFEEKNIARKLTDVKSYAFSFLVQSFLSSQKPYGGTPRSESPGQRDISGGSRRSEDEGVDMKEVDGLLSEAAMMLSRWSLYCRFIATKCSASEDSFNSHLSLPNFISQSSLQKKASNSLIEPFNVMTTFLIRRSVEKSFQLDEPPPDLSLNPNKPLKADPPFITSAVDDIMYIVNQVLQRSLATSQRAVVASVIPTVGRVLGSDFVGMVQRKMRDESYPKAAIQGALPPEGLIVAFLVLINNLDVASDYVRRIVQTSTGSNRASTQNGQNGSTTTPLVELFPFKQDAVFVENSLKSLQSGFEAKTSELINEAIQVMFQQVMRPRLRPVLIETFRDVDYNQADDDIGGQGADDRDDRENLVAQRFERGWMALMLPIKRILTERNFDRLTTTVATYLSKTLEKRIWSYYGRVNELGAVRMERDIAGIVGAAVKGGRYGLRDAFTRCLQMTLIINMEDDEWEELQRDADGGIAWQLDAGERQRTRAIVQDRI